MTTDTKTQPIQLGEPVEHRGIVVTPLFPRLQPRAEYLTFDEAAPLGFRVAEIDEAGSVPQLLVENPLDANVLLYDGEELVGAKQNRILNVTVLVEAHGKTNIPVSCVEQGRWSRRSRYFAPAASAAYPELRRRKAEQLLAAPAELGAAQAEVWDAVAFRTGVHSPTGAQRDIFDAHEGELAELRKAFPLEPGQSGMLLAIGPERLCLDCVSRPTAFAWLYPKLLEGAMLDAIEHVGAKPSTTERLERFLVEIEAADRARGASVGLGEDVRVATETIIGSGLEVDGELVQLSGFSRGRRVIRSYSSAAADSRLRRSLRAQDAAFKCCLRTPTAKVPGSQALTSSRTGRSGGPLSKPMTKRRPSALPSFRRVSTLVLCCPLSIREMAE